jgi:hypothetical protein
MPSWLARPGIWAVVFGSRRVGGVPREPCTANTYQPGFDEWKGGLQCARQSGEGEAGDNFQWEDSDHQGEFGLQ